MTENTCMNESHLPANFSTKDIKCFYSFLILVLFLFTSHETRNEAQRHYNDELRTKKCFARSRPPPRLVLQRGLSDKSFHRSIPRRMTPIHPSRIIFSQIWTYRGSRNTAATRTRSRWGRARGPTTGCSSTPCICPAASSPPR